MPGLVVEEATEVTPELVAALNRLIPQLSSSSPPVTEADVAEIVRSTASRLLVARLASDGETVGDIVGTLTLGMFRVPTGTRAHIEDVVVDESARGRGVGEALTLRAIDMAGEENAKTVDLTSRPSREAANRLYQRLGFERRDTNVYRYTR
jgi:ribosomal protein S18 acetylase RimI-like enzyme